MLLKWKIFVSKMTRHDKPAHTNDQVEDQVSAPKEMVNLVERFNDHLAEYKSGKYKETEVRRDFIDPMFEALGWDVANKAGYAEQYREVIHEDAIKIGRTTKAPDYCFTLHGRRMFFVEAKKPSVNIEKDIAAAYQVRRYAWTAKLQLSILTDFEEFAVYDCRVKPDKKDKASRARVLYIKFDQYVDRWDEIARVFSKEAILKGSFDNYIEEKGVKRGTAVVDDEFLAEIESWRELLAKNIALRNPTLDQRLINFAVQRVIDRIIFLRICEDRGIEEYGQLMALQNGNNNYSRMLPLLRKSDQKYNSGLFHFSNEKGRATDPDKISLRLMIDDKVIKTVLSHLYYPDSPYEFSVLPSDILGQVYERFLGKVIRLTAGHRAKVEDKPEVKKAGGVFYTPTYVVEYIVKLTLGKIVENKTPSQVAKIRVCDPACGSGSFLLGAYQFLLDWYRDYYVERGSRTQRRLVFQGPGGEWRLVTQERKRILLTNIFGVDIDPQAVEVTKLSLLLKVLEGENEDTLNRQLSLLQERALPDLGNNIKCGNSLIEPDFWDDGELALFSEDEKDVNPFDWDAGFPSIMAGGGFDAIIGNPPYIRIQRIQKKEADYFYSHYESPTSKMDISLIFLERALVNLLKINGIAGFICTSQWLSTNYGKNLRRMLSDGRLRRLVHFGSLPVFKTAQTYPAIFIISPKAEKELSFTRIKRTKELSLHGIQSAPVVNMATEDLGEDPWLLGGINLPKHLSEKKINYKILNEIGKAYIGTKSGRNDTFVLSIDQAESYGLEESILIPYAKKGSDVERYCTVDTDLLIIYPYQRGKDGKPILISEKTLRTKYPMIHAHLLKDKKLLRVRKDSRKYYADGYDWYRHLRAGKFTYIEAPKLALKGIALRPSVGLLPVGVAFDGARCPSIIIDDLHGHDIKYFLALLNSKALAVYLNSYCPQKLNGYVEYSAKGLGKAPIRLLDLSNRKENAQHDSVVKLSQSLISLHARLGVPQTPTEIAQVRTRIIRAEKRLDAIIYTLYGLDDGQIEFIESDVVDSL